MSIDHNRIKVADLEKGAQNQILVTKTNGELEFSDINNTLDCTVPGKVLDARQGKVLQDNKVDKVTGKSLLSDTEITRLGTLSNYTHPANHPPSIIAQDVNNRFVTDAEKATWNAKQSSLGFTAENVANKNVANGYAGLGADGKLISSQLPLISISNTLVTASQAEMLAVTAETGDIAVRTDLNKSFILKGSNPTLLADWQELLSSTNAVTTVFGRNGLVTAQIGDYTADQITETATKKFQSANQQAFNDATSSIQTQLNSKQPSGTYATGTGSVIGINTGDNAVNSLYNGLVSNATHTGDATGSTALTVKGINGTLLSGLATGILKNTTTTGVPVIAVASDFPILNQNTTGTAGTITGSIAQSQVTNLVTDLGLKVDKVTGKSLLSDTEITRLGTLSNYTHPANHAASIITQDASNRFVTDAEKSTWNAKQSSLGFTAENVANKNVANGYAGLGADGKLISSQLPLITISNTLVTASQAEMLAVIAETGDIAVRTDLNKSFILKGSNPTLLADWQELLSPTSAVTTVFGRNGSVTAQTGDYSADQINETATRKFQSANQQAFNDATSSIQTQLNGKQAAGNYEPAFSKNTAFNKNFGTSSGTITEGNDLRVINGQTAFGWGNHAGLYRPISYIPTWNEIMTKPTTIAGFGITDALGTSTMHYVGTTNLAFNRASAAQTLTGISIDGNAGTASNLVNGGGRASTSGSQYLSIDSTDGWSYLSLKKNGNTVWDIAQHNGGNLEFRSAGLETSSLSSTGLFSTSKLVGGVSSIANISTDTTLFGIFTSDGKYMNRNWHLNDGAFGYKGHSQYRINSSDTPIGGAILQTGVNHGERSGDWLPVDPTKTYKVSIWVKQVSGTSTHYLSLSQQNAEKSANNGNGQWGMPYWWANSTFPTTWTEKTMTIGPSGSGADYTFESTTRFVQLGVLLNYTGTGVAAISGHKIEEVDNTLAGGTKVLGSLTANNAGYSWTPNTSSAHRFQTPTGYLDIGPMNSSFCHFQTDRPTFYFGKSVEIDGTLKRYGDSALYLHANNYNYYSPTLTGAGASGTWGINITGSSSNATTVGGIATNRIVYGDGSRGKSTSKTNGNADTCDDSNSSGFYFGSSVTGMPDTNWWSWMNVAGDSWSGSDGYGYQMASSFWSDDLRYRRLTSGGWNSWKSILHSGNYSSYSVFSGAVEASGAGGFKSSTYLAGARNPIWRFGNADTYGLSYFQGTAGFGGQDVIGMHFGDATSIGSLFSFAASGNLMAKNNIACGNSLMGAKIGVTSGDGNGDGLSLYGGANAGQPAYGLMFARTNNFGTQGGVTGDWATYLTMTGESTRGWIFKHGSGTSGNVASISSTGAITGASLTVTGDVTAFSDARVKENIRPITNVIERIQASRGVIYDRIDTKQKDNIGFIAQELEATFPELVLTQEDGTKAVKYQNAVAVLFEAIKEQQSQIVELKNLITKLVKS